MLRLFATNITKIALILVSHAIEELYLYIYKLTLFLPAINLAFFP